MLNIVIYFLSSWTSFSSWYAYLSRAKNCLFKKVLFICYLRLRSACLKSTMKRYVLIATLNRNYMHGTLNTPEAVRIVMHESLHCAGGIRKRRFHSENASDICRQYTFYAGKFWNESVTTGHFGLIAEESSGREIILSRHHRSRIVPFWPFFKMFSVHSKTQGLRFEIHPVWRAFSTNSKRTSQRFFCPRKVHQKVFSLEIRNRQLVQAPKSAFTPSRQ